MTAWEVAECLSHTNTHTQRNFIKQTKTLSKAQKIFERAKQMTNFNS